MRVMLLKEMKNGSNGDISRSVPLKVTLLFPFIRNLLIQKGAMEVVWKVQLNAKAMAVQFTCLVCIK
jgi:hypothetical protein